MSFFDWLRQIFNPAPPVPRELRMVSYDEADVLLKQGWRLAPEEDNNRILGMVYLERPL